MDTTVELEQAEEAAALLPPPNSTGGGMDERAQLIAGLRELAALCDQNGISLPERIQIQLHSIEDSEEEVRAASGWPGDAVERPRHLLEQVRERRQYRYSSAAKNVSTKSMVELGPVAKRGAQFATDSRLKNISVDLRMRDVSYTVRVRRERQRRQGCLKGKEGGSDGGLQRGTDEEKGFADEEKADCANGSEQDGDVGIEQAEEVGSKHPRRKRLSTSIKQMIDPVDKKVLLDGINLRFESGKMYLVLGAPGCGKSLLLKSIAGRLRRDKDHRLNGTVSINGQTCRKHPDLYWPNLVAYTDQVDQHHPLLTVREVLDFAFQCSAGGTHRTSEMPTDDPDVADFIRKCDEEDWRVNIVCKGANLEKAKNTFLGDPNEATVRGVSGGERRRVSLAEPWMARKPFICLDEMSTGLDSATTFEIIKTIGEMTSYNNRVVLMSLLQPQPEVIALFDELILLDKGRIIYAGPTDEVVPYFEDLGYTLPDRVDMADWLQALPTPDGARFLKERSCENGPIAGSHRTHQQFVEDFRMSERGLALAESIKAPLDEAAQEVPLRKEFTRRYQNSWSRSLRLCFERELLLLRRNKRRWKMRIVQDTIMGLVSGTLFWQIENQVAVMGVLFYVLVFVMLGNVPPTALQLATRGIFYKEHDASFYPTWTFVLGRALASLPIYTLDSVLFGTIVFFFSGRAYNDGATIGNYFIFVLVLFTMGLSCSLVYSIFSSFSTSKPAMQARMAVLLAVFIIFSGFVVQPDVIPGYWIWLYWLNVYAWAYRALVVNEFQSGKYVDTAPTGDQIMEQFGFVDNGGEPFQFEWVWWGILFLFLMGIIALMTSTLILDNVRVSEKIGAESTKKKDSTDDDVEQADDSSELESFDLPFKRVDLTFHGIRYTAESSISKEPIELLKGVCGCVESGKMTALMGSSGAGKTTLMDVLALRKSNGEVDGVVKLNGHIQEAKSFRRCTGYVEQFDLQSPQLTILETVEFSAKLRLDASDPHVTPESTQKFVSKTLQMLELTPIKDLLVGSDLAKTGLTFEQKKRLSIAVELVSNPSIIFLDEPTSGLDARGASVVMRGLRKIALTGRAICATIHQPSTAMFNAFDSLLLLKRGGETVFFGDIGTESRLLIEYLEQYEATPRIIPGENPATWMLKVIGAGSSQGTRFDYAAAYEDSEKREECLGKIKMLNAQASEDNLVSYPSKYATDKKTQSLAVFARLNKIYWRSPSYNLSRVIVSGIIALMMGSIFAAKRAPSNESDMNSRVASIFITTMFLGVTSFNTTLPVFEVERNMFYRHKAALMYNQGAINLAFTLAEVKFILFACMVFMICFYFLVGFSTLAYKFFLFYLFTTFNMFTWTYLGQMMMSLMASSVAAQQMGSLLVGMSTLFAGIVIRPQFINDFWKFMYWMLPVQYILQGMVASQFHNDASKIEPYPGSDYWKALEEKCGEDKNCWASEGTAEFWVEASFGGLWAFENLWYCVLYLVGIILVSRGVTYIALTKLNYLSK